LSKSGRNAGAARAFVAKLYKNVPVLDSGARGSTTTFVERGIGDVEIAWESDAMLAVEKLGPGHFEIVRPPLSILAEPPVSLVDGIVDKKGTRAVAQAYLNYLYSPQGQDIIARHYFRPRLPSVARRYSHQFPAIKMVTIAQFGGWNTAQQTYFADGGVFDQIYQPNQQ
jgi:sulfate transport system substrate-binding protein